MTARDFTFWLQGFFELGGQEGVDGLTARQIQTIRNHLDLVFVHEIDGSDPSGKLQAAHDGKPVIPPPPPPAWPKKPGQRC